MANEEDKKTTANDRLLSPRALLILFVAAAVAVAVGVPFALAGMVPFAVAGGMGTFFTSVVALNTLVE